MMSFTSDQEQQTDPPANPVEILSEASAGRLEPGRVAELSDPSRDQLAAYRSAWNTLSESIKRDIIREMGRQIEANLAVDFSRYFRLALSDDDDEVRALAARFLWEVDDSAVLDELCSRAREEQAGAVQEAIARTLGGFSYKVELDELDSDRAASVQSALFHLIDHGANWMVRRRALESAAYMSRNEAIKSMIQSAYESDFEQEQAGALVAMGRNLDSRWFPIVMAELRNDDPDIRCEAARAAGEFGNPSSIEALAKMIDDEDEEIREVSIRAIGQIGGERAIDALRYIETQIDDELKPVVREAIEEAEFLAEPTGLER
jgi:HEAT repeat protein